MIHLKRRNLLKMLVSRKISQKLNWWFSNAGMHTHCYSLEDKRIELEFNEVKTFFERYHRLMKQFEDYFRKTNFLTVYFEELINQRQDTYRKILEYLDIPDFKPKTYLQRQNSESCATLITNFDTLRDSFQSTPWSHLFDHIH